jgi:2-iminobutanoate/2-iminopropanoate deaminase
VVSIDLGNSKMLIISGQIAFDNKGNLIGKGDMAKQTEQAFLNIKSIVEDAGGTMNDVVKLGNFLTDISQIQTVRRVRDKFINTKNPPASTTVQVSKLVRDDLMIEIEATAIIPNKSK